MTTTVFFSSAIEQDRNFSPTTPTEAKFHGVEIEKEDGVWQKALSCSNNPHKAGLGEELVPFVKKITLDVIVNNSAIGSMCIGIYKEGDTKAELDYHNDTGKSLLIETNSLEELCNFYDRFRSYQIPITTGWGSPVETEQQGKIVALQSQIAELEQAKTAQQEEIAAMTPQLEEEVTALEKDNARLVAVVNHARKDLRAMRDNYENSQIQVEELTEKLAAFQTAATENPTEPEQSENNNWCNIVATS